MTKAKVSSNYVFPSGSRLIIGEAQTYITGMTVEYTPTEIRQDEHVVRQDPGPFTVTVQLGPTLPYPRPRKSLATSPGAEQESLNLSPPVRSEVFYHNLSTKVKNALRRHAEYLRGQGLAEIKPWDMSVKDLLRIPGIGPAKVREIADAIYRSCL